MSSLFDSGPVLLDGPDTMLAILKELAGENALKYRGGIDVWGEQNPPGPAKWRLRLNDDKGNKVQSLITQSDGVLEGEYLAKVYGRLIVLAADEVNTNAEGDPH